MGKQAPQAHVRRATASVLLTLFVDIVSAFASAALVEFAYEQIWGKQIGDLPFWHHVILVGIKLASSVVATEVLRLFFAVITNSPQSLLSVLLISVGQTGIIVGATLLARRLTITWVGKVQEKLFGGPAIAVMVVRSFISSFVKNFVDFNYGSRLAGSRRLGEFAGMCLALACSLFCAHVAVGIADWAALSDHPRETNAKVWWRVSGQPSAIHYGKAVARYWGWAILGRLVWGII